MFKKEQIEEFDISETILINLASDEEIIYKLKIIFDSKKERILNFIILISGYIFFLILIPLLRLIGYRDIIILVGIIALIIVFPEASIAIHYLSSPLNYSLYITNKKIYFLNGKWKNEYLYFVMELNSIKTVNIISKKNLKINGNKGKLEILYNNSERAKLITPKLNNVLEIKKIIESILWQYANISERLKEFKFPLEYKNKKDTQKIQIYNDWIIYQDNKKESEINFGNGLNISDIKKEATIPNIFSFDFFEYRRLHLPYYPIKIWITSPLNSQQIRFGSLENYLEVCEIVCLKLISWKNNNKLLLNKADLLYIQKSHIYTKPKLNLKEIENDFKTFEISQDLVQPFEKSLDKNEKILFAHFPKKQILKNFFLSFIIFFCGFIAFYISDIIFGSSLLIFELILLLSILPVVFIGLWLEFQSGDYLFTSQKILIRFGKKICFAFYSDISKIICNLEKNRECIDIYFKNRINGDCIKKEIDFLEILPPKSLKIFEKLKYLTRF